MRTHRFLVSAALVSALALLGAGTAWADPLGPQGPRGDGPMRMERMLGQLDLTDAQREQIETILDVHRNAAAGQRADLHAARAALADRIHADVFDEQAIRDAAAAVATIEVDIALSRATLLQQVRGVLTPEQQDRLEQLHERRFRHMSDGAGPWHEGHRRRHPRPGVGS